MRRIYAAYEEQWRKFCETSRYRDKTLRVDEVENGVVLPLVRSGLDASLRQDSGLYRGGVATADFEFVAGFLRGADEFDHQGWFGVNAAYAVPEKRLSRVDEDVIFGGVLFRHFGHFILEGMTRFWYFLQYPEDRRRIVFVLAPILGSMDVPYNFCDLLGIARERVLVVERPTRFARITVPEEASHTLAFFTDAYRAPHQRLMEVCGRGDDRKVYLTRSAFQKEYGPFHINEEYFEHFYAGKGFRIASPERLPLREQIRLVAGADEVVSTLSTLSHFALFCRPGTRFTMLTRTDRMMTLQHLVNEASGVDWTIVDVSANCLCANQVLGPVLLGPTAYWREYARDRYGEEVEDDSIREQCWQYLRQWSEFYSDPKLFRLIRRLDAYDFLDRLYRTTHGTPLPFARPATERKEKRRKRPPSVAALTAECIRLKNALNALRPLSDDAEKAAWAEAKRPLLRADVYVAHEGWITGLYETEEWRGQKEPTQGIKALRCRFADNMGWQISCRVRDWAGRWGDWVATGDLVGNTRSRMPLTGVAFRFDGGGPAARYSARYRVKSAGEGEWSAWFEDGADCVADAGSGIAAIQLELSCRRVPGSGGLDPHSSTPTGISGTLSPPNT